MSTNSRRIYLSPPHIEGPELDLVQEAFESNWVAPVGPFVDRFEAAAAARVGVRYAVALSSGTAGIHLALRAAGVTKGDRVLCSTLTFIGSAGPICHLGAEPVFVDSEASSWNIDPDLIAEALDQGNGRRRQPKALIAVDVMGQCADYARLEPLCRQQGVFLIEDAAEALGATCGGRAAGSFGDCSVISFNGNKIITTSGGGMLLSNTDSIVGKARFWATQARDPAVHYEHSEIGYNYRLSNLLAALGCGQLELLDQRVRQRQRNFEWYRRRLGDLPGLSFMPEAAFGKATRWLSCIQIDPTRSGTNREAVRTALESVDIEARPVWKPLHLQPAFREFEIVGGSVAESIFATGLCLPSGSSLGENDLDRIVETVRGCWPPKHH